MQLNSRQRTWGVDPSIAKRRRPRRSRPRPGDSRPPRVRLPLPAKGEQLSFADQRTWGGPRPDAGRKVQSARPKVPHRVRPGHASYNPVHVTMRRAKGLPGFRAERLHQLLREAIRLLRIHAGHPAQLRCELAQGTRHLVLDQRQQAAPLTVEVRDPGLLPLQR